MRSTSFAHCQCLDWLNCISFSMEKAGLLMHTILNLQDWTRKLKWNGGSPLHLFELWWAQERICSFHSSALPCGVLPLVPNALYSQMTLLEPLWAMDIIGPPFLWRAEQEVRVGAMWGGWLTFLWMSEKGFAVVLGEFGWPGLLNRWIICSLWTSTAIGLWEHRIPSDLRS